MNKLISSIFALVLLSFGMSSCFPTENREPPIASVSVMFPSDDNNAHWKDEQSTMINYLSSLNFAVYYAVAKDGDGAEQAKQIKQMQDWAVEYIVLASVDTYSQQINDALTAYVAAGGKVICYDRLQQHTATISAYVSSSYRAIGELQATAILSLPAASKVEIVSGPSYDVNAKTIFSGVSGFSDSYINSGTWVCPSGNTTYEKTKMADWGKDEAYRYAKNIFSTYYPSQTLPDAMLVANDAQAAGVLQAIEEHNPTLTKYPLITGLDCTEAALVRIVNDRQTMTVAKDLANFIVETSSVLNKMVKKQTIITSKNMSNGLIDVPYIEVEGLKAIYKKDIK